MEIITHSKHGQNINDFERAASMIVGGMIALKGLEKKTATGYMMALAGAELMRRGVTGCSYSYKLFGVSTAPRGQGRETTSVPYPLGIRVDSSITINRSPADVYRFWRNFENLPRFMRHLESVTVLDGNKSRWVARAPAHSSVTWDAEIINEMENQLIGWRSLEGSQVQNAGSVQFSPASGGHGTLVRVELQYNPPAGILGAVVAKMFGEEPEQQIREDLHRLKQVLEAGETATTEGQPSGQREEILRHA